MAYYNFIHSSIGLKYEAIYYINIDAYDTVSFHSESDGAYISISK